MRFTTFRPFILLLVTSLVSFAGCTKNTDSASSPINYNSNMNAPTNDTGKRYLALGDSYTIGQSVQENERFPAQTVALLRQQGIAIKDPEYIAVTGWTTTNLINAINTQNPRGPYDLVTLLIGVNDQYQHLDTAGYRVRFTQLLNKSIELAGNQRSKVFVLSIPDYSVTPFVAAEDKVRVSTEVDQFNSINKQITLQNNVAYIDITPSSRQAKNNPALIANDGLHPSGLQYTQWTNLLAPLAKKILQ